MMYLIWVAFFAMGFIAGRHFMRPVLMTKLEEEDIKDLIEALKRDKNDRINK